jgi:hypothetical protein
MAVSSDDMSSANRDPFCHGTYEPGLGGSHRMPAIDSQRAIMALNHD